jgi:hypothetical protein
MTFQEPTNIAEFEEHVVREVRDDECPRHTAIGVEDEGYAEHGLRRLRLFTKEEKEKLKCTCKK